MNPSAELPVADSVSCLHAIEHFGLGRYGDSLDPQGHLKAFAHLIRMVVAGGTLYMGLPIGRKNEIHFNAHRVFALRDILLWPGSDSLRLSRFDYVDDQGRLNTDVDLSSELPVVSYGCGVYTFVRK
jgi:hypothetical protein